MKTTTEHAEHATKGRPTKRQLAKITDFGKYRLAKRLPGPPQLFEDRKLKMLQNVPENLPREAHGRFYEILPVR